MTRLTHTIVFVLALVCAKTAAADTTVPALLALMNERLAVQVQVAEYKWNAKAPIEDREREALLLSSVVALAAKQPLPPQKAEEFFRAQIEAGKAIQRILFQRWQDAGQGHFTDAPDLATTIRPALDRLTPALLSALAAATPNLPDPENQSRIREVPDAWRGMPDVWAIAVQPLVR